MRIEQNEILVVDQPALFSTPLQSERSCIRVHVRMPKGNLLKIAAVGNCASETLALKVRAHIFRSQIVSSRTCSTAFESVVGEKLKMSAKSLGSDATETLFNVWRKLGLGPQGSREERECWQEKSAQSDHGGRLYRAEAN
jgi:hypothetical protein